MKKVVGKWSYYCRDDCLIIFFDSIVKNYA